ncbi:MAG: hypothetical protein NTZ78_04775 [Candidatus Aureabacteria bacterium]|nr:hypothetical protein [Candidatus Auribacterota bacterium]
MMNTLIVTLLSFPLVTSWLFWGNNPGVKMDLGKIEKTPALTCGILGGVPRRVQKIQIVSSSSKAGKEIAVLGQSMITFVSCENYEINNQISFMEQDIAEKKSKLGLNPELVDADNDGNLEIMMGGGALGGVGLLDETEKLIWSFHPDHMLPPNKMIHGDLDKDGTIEFYVADPTGLYQLDAKGTLLKKFSDGWISDIHIVDDPHATKPLLVALTHRREFRFYDFSGALVRKFKPAYRFSRFDIVNWPSSPNILIGVKGFHRWRAVLLDLEGKTVFDHILPSFWFAHGPEGVAVRFSEKEPPYLAVVGHTRGLIRSPLTQLSIFSPSGELIYRENLKANKGLCVNDCKKGKNETLLAGDDGCTVWEYSLK